MILVTDFDDRVCHQYLCSRNEYRNIETKTLIESCSPGSNSDGSLVQLSDCVVSSPEVAGINRQTLTLVQSLILPILYCTLVGADHLRYGAEELRNAFSNFSHLTMESKWFKMSLYLKMVENARKTQIHYCCYGFTWCSGTSVLCVGGDNTLPRVYSRMYFIFLLLYFGTDIQFTVSARTGGPVDTKKVIVVSQKLNEKFYRLNKKVNRDLFT